MLSEPSVLGLQGGISAIEWSKHRSVDRPQVCGPSAFCRLHIASPEGDGLSCLKCFSEVILVDKANPALADYDLYLLGHFLLLLLLWRSLNSLTFEEHLSNLLRDALSIDCLLFSGGDILRELQCFSNPQGVV